MVLYDMFSWEMGKKCLLTSNNEWIKDRKISKAQRGETMSFIGIPYRNMRERLHIGTETAQSQLYHQSPLQHGWQLTRAGNLVHTAAPALRSCSVSLSPLQASQLVFDSSRQFKLISASLGLIRLHLPGSWDCLRMTLSSLYCLHSLEKVGRGKLVNLISFREFLNLFESFTSCVNKLPCRIEHFTIPLNILLLVFPVNILF